MDPTKSSLYTAKRSSGISINQDVRDSWGRIRSESCPSNFVLVKYDTPNSVRCAEEGTGGIHELISKLVDDDIYFGAFSVDINGAKKFFTLYFVGGGVNGMKKGKASLHKAAVLNVFEGTHGDVTCNNGLAEATVDYFKKNILQIMRLTDSDIL